MKELILITAIIFAACNGQVHHEKENKDQAEQHATDHATLPAAEGKKWKADSATKFHVASIQQLVNDAKFDNPKFGRQLASDLKLKVDALVKDCTMKGPEHDALHVWLEGLLHNIKELQQGEAGEYPEVREKLQKHVAGFYGVFE